MSIAHGQEHSHEHHDDKHDHGHSHEDMATTTGTKRMAMSTRTRRNMVPLLPWDHEHGHDHGHSHDHKSRFKDPADAAEFDQRGLSDMRIKLTTKLIEALTLKGGEAILDLATGTGRISPAVVEADAMRPHRRCRRGAGDARCRPSP